MHRQYAFGVIVAFAILAGTLAATKPKSTCVNYKEVPQFNKYVYFVPNVTVSSYAAEGLCAALGGDLLTIRSIAEFDAVSKLSDKYGRNEEAYYWMDFDTTTLKMERNFDCAYIIYRDREALWGNSDCQRASLHVACEISK
uniref:C-type lectin domain-containing protein n=1 Tax=Plectus sambesii TaxID=2011161 RepID=A0A914VZJ2_9BILA